MGLPLLRRVNAGWMAGFQRDVRSLSEVRAPRESNKVCEAERGGKGRKMRLSESSPRARTGFQIGEKKVKK